MKGKEGLQLMNLMLRENKISWRKSWTMPWSNPGAETIVDIYKLMGNIGWQTIFPLFITFPKNIKKMGTTHWEGAWRTYVFDSDFLPVESEETPGNSASE